MIVVNKKNKFDNQLLLEELVSVPRQYHGSNGKEYRLNKELLKNFEIMYNTAKKENINLNIISAYRSRDYQNRLYKNSVSKRGLAYTNKYIARPGYSEHETGLAIDVNRIKLSFEKTKEYRWLRDNSYKFGFILRYPKGKEEITGYSFEPWHYRYVGVDVASVIHKEDLTLEEYLERYGRE